MSMKVNLINQYKDRFKEHLKSDKLRDERFKYENLSNYRQHWDLDELNVLSMYSRSYTSKTSNRLWGGSQNSGKEVMEQFIDMDKEFVRSMFRDLFDEKKAVNLRIDRFTFHCDELLGVLQRQHKKVDRHFHSTPELPFLYLCFEAPLTYPLYDFDLFSKALELFEVKSPLQSYEVERYHKLSKAIFTILSKDQRTPNCP